MQPTHRQITTLYSRLHDRRPTAEERRRLKEKIRYAYVLEPPWELLAAPTKLGPSRLGLLWLVLDSGPAGSHPAIIEALEWLRPAHDPDQASPTPEARREALSRSLDALVKGERQPRGLLEYCLRFTARRSGCGQCGAEVGPGFLGWYQAHSQGPLCRACLAENAPSLTLLLDASVFGLPTALQMSAFRGSLLGTEPGALRPMKSRDGKQRTSKGSRRRRKKKAGRRPSGEDRK